MVQATTETTRRPSPTEAYHAMSENQFVQLKMLSDAINGISSLSFDGELAAARDGVDITREDLASIFGVLHRHLKFIMDGIPLINPARR